MGIQSTEYCKGQTLHDISIKILKRKNEKGPFIFAGKSNMETYFTKCQMTVDETSTVTSWNLAWNCGNPYLLNIYFSL
jgi:hypothetical protein